MRRVARRRRSWSLAGYALLEMLLSLGLLAMIVAALTGGLTLARKAFDGGRIHQAAGDLEAAAAALSRLLEQASPVVVLNGRGGAEPTFRGDSDACAFIGLSEGDVQRAGLIAVRIGLAPGRRGADLVLWTREVRVPEALAALASAMDRTEAARDVATLSFSYFGQIEEGKPPRWSDAWSGERLPQLVAVRLGAVRFGQRIDLSFTVALRQTRPSLL